MSDLRTQIAAGLAWWQQPMTEAQRNVSRELIMVMTDGRLLDYRQPLLRSLPDGRTVPDVDKRHVDIDRYLSNYGGGEYRAHA